MQELQWLSDRLDVLLKKYTSVRAENVSLKKKLAQHEEKIAALNRKLAVAGKHALAIEIGHALPDEKDKARVRKQLDAVIGEIDKILTTLND